MSGGVRGRYAPSPTGALHLGNLRTALLGWLLARSAGGGFILRMEDLDAPRTRLGAAEGMLADLRWLGLDWDEGPDVGGPFGPYTQSARHAIYLGALARLRARGLLYPCYCTRAELRGSPSIASAPHAGDLPPRYPGTCRQLSARQRRAREAEGRHPSLRFRAPDEPISFTDRVMGAQSEQVSATTGDFIVRRSDGLIAYHLAVVVDDALMGVTQVARGADLLAVTAPQRALALALGYPPPREYAHLPLATDATGARLAKRDAAAGVDALRARGLAPEQVVGALAASVGLWPAGEPATPRELLSAFDLARIPAQPSPIALG
ncbi:MAG: tRNA glutamyl-Q(34) synthetase GluQRS [Ktedonobacterales bacterium]|jgi:glutamyl-tRNA synthetase